MQEELLNWAASVSITDAKEETGRCLGDALYISNFPDAGGRGLAAARDLKQGQIILRIPKEALFNVDIAKQDRKFRTAWMHFPNLSSTQVLIAYLLNEVGKGHASSWYVYMKYLPKIYHTFAHFCGFEIQALQVKRAVWSAERSVEKIRNEWKATLPLLKILALKHHLITWKAWQWASSTVSSRSLHIPWDDAGTLCPIGDLFNYAAPGDPFNEKCVDQLDSSVSGGVLHEVNAQDDNDRGSGLHVTERLTDGGYDVDAKDYIFYAREDYKQGQQVLLCYGQYNNLELLEHYGFILPNNPNDDAYVSVFSCEEITQNLGWMQSQQLHPHTAMRIRVDGRPSFQLLAMLRLFCASATLRKHAGHLALAGLQLSKEGDIDSYERLKEKCQQYLKSLPTSLMADIVLEDVLSFCHSFEGLVGLVNCIDKGSRGREVEDKDHCKLLADAISTWKMLPENDQALVLHELKGFLESRKGISSRESDVRLERWWLAIKWRKWHKQIVHRCIAVCDSHIVKLKHCISPAA